MKSVPTCAALAVIALTGGCSTIQNTARTATDVESEPLECHVAAASGDVAMVRRESGELVIANGGDELLRSSDLGQTWRREAFPVSCRWPGAASSGRRLLISCSEPTRSGRLLVTAERFDGGWRSPVVVDVADGMLIDTNLQALGNGEVVLLATHVDRPDDLDHARYSIRLYRSGDRGSTWSAPEIVIAGRRGEHLEDTRTVGFADGRLLLAFERETAEGLPSRVEQMASADGGRTWAAPAVIWSGGDLEPGGFVEFPDGGLWFVASSDARAGGGSYDRALIYRVRSTDRGRTWSPPAILVDAEDQLSFGGVALSNDEVLLASVRHYRRPRLRALSLFVVERGGGGAAACLIRPLSTDGFERGLAPQWRIPKTP